MSDDPAVDEFTPEMIVNASTKICHEMLFRAEQLENVRHFVHTSLLRYENVRIKHYVLQIKINP